MVAFSFESLGAGRGWREPKTIEEKIIPLVCNDIGETFDRFATSKERVADFWAKLEPVIKVLGDKFVQRVKFALQNCAQVDDREEFVRQVLDIVSPAFSTGSVEQVEAGARKLFVEQNGLTALNEIFSYNVDPSGDKVHIHWAPSRTIPVEKRIEWLLDGMQKLAQIVKADEQIKQVVASSWIITKMPQLITGGGFEMDGPMDLESKQQLIGERALADTNDDWKVAHISRENLIKLYGGYQYVEES